jgi:hypothetical protein
MNEINIEKIEWLAPEYNHKERSNDWFWTIGLVTIIACILAIYFGNYVFAIFLFISGASLIFFSLRHPPDVMYKMETKGLTMGKDFYEWKNIKSFNIKNTDDAEAKLLIETKKYLLPVYTIPVPKEMIEKIKTNIILIIPRSEIDESKSMVFMEKLGF